MWNSAPTGKRAVGDAGPYGEAGKRAVGDAGPYGEAGITGRPYLDKKTAVPHRGRPSSKH